MSTVDGIRECYFSIRGFAFENRTETLQHFVISSTKTKYLNWKIRIGTSPVIRFQVLIGPFRTISTMKFIKTDISLLEI